MPTLVATPWPSGPVVVSTPEVQRYSGWPGHLLSSWRNRLMSSSVTDCVAERLVLGIDRLHAGQMQHGVEQHRGVADRQHEAIAIRPDRMARVEAQKALPQAVDHRRQRHRRAGMAGVGLLHRVHRQRAQGRHAQLINGPVGSTELPVPWRARQPQPCS